MALKDAEKLKRKQADYIDDMSDLAKEKASKINVNRNIFTGKSSGDVVSSEGKEDAKDSRAAATDDVSGGDGLQLDEEIIDFMQIENTVTLSCLAMKYVDHSNICEAADWLLLLNAILSPSIDNTQKKATLSASGLAVHKQVLLLFLNNLQF
jgi:hypothetical protein